jgi:hypothetical protein
MKSIDKLIRTISENQIEFFDFGCSQGKSIAYCRKHFAKYGNGLGIDIDPAKVEKARCNGFEAFCVDILKLPDQKIVRFTSMIHFLEHLNSFMVARLILRKAARVSRDFIWIRLPYFDADGFLFRESLKCYWSDWGGHQYCMSTLELFRICRELREDGLIAEFDIGWNDRIRNSGRAEILPASSPKNQHSYDYKKHGEKSDIVFDFPVYRELRALLHISKPVDSEFSHFDKWEIEINSSRGE